VLLALLVAFGNGVLSFVVPCSAVLLPVCLGLLAGSVAELPDAQQARRVLAGSSLYVVGFTAVFVTLGVAGGSLTSTVADMGGRFQRTGGVAVLLVAALLLADARWGWLSAWARRPAPWPALTALVVGVIVGCAFAPFVGPFLATALALADTSRGGMRGGLLLAAYAIGIAVPFVLAAFGVAASPTVVRRLARWSSALSWAGAGALALLGALLATGGYGAVTDFLARTLPFANP
jgi:cytochrome c-type biogenesis protein